MGVVDYGCLKRSPRLTTNPLSLNQEYSRRHGSSTHTEGKMHRWCVVHCACACKEERGREGGREKEREVLRSEVKKDSTEVN